MSEKEKAIANYQKKLGLSAAEAEELWLADNGIIDNEEQDALDKTASKVKVNVGVEVAKKERKPREIKVSDEKKELFATILRNLDRTDGVLRENITVLKENKLIQVKIGEKTFEIDLREKRPPKK